MLADLKEASKREDSDELKRLIQTVRERRFAVDMHLELKQAEKDVRRQQTQPRFVDAPYFPLQVELLKRRPKRRMLTLNSAMISEIRRYSKPPRVMHAVLQATLLLLGEPEYLTDVKILNLSFKGPNST